MIKKLLFIFGTRPEAIKMAPLIKELEGSHLFRVFVCVTGQHREMLDQVLEFFNIKPDYDLNLMKPNQSLIDITARGLTSLDPIINNISPDFIFVQGDTTSVLIGALAGYYCKIPVVHIEAGLRSGNMYSPFPEEGNRKVAGHLSYIHFAPTERAKENLIFEGIKNHVYVVGNTVIDALFLGLGIISSRSENHFIELFNDIDFSKKLILVTGHRRESFGKPFEDICNALKEIAERFRDVEIIYPVHLNPNVQEPVKRILNKTPNIHLIKPQNYPSLIWLMNKSTIVLTDSGGIQEEAPSLGKPVLVMRDVT